MNELKTLKDMVRQVLIKEPATRNSDDFLYYRICEKINKGCIGLPFCEVIMNRKDYGFPSFESVRRTRQKIQAESPELSSTDDIQAMRSTNEKIFREFARG